MTEPNVQRADRDTQGTVPVAQDHPAESAASTHDKPPTGDDARTPDKGQASIGDDGRSTTIGIDALRAERSASETRNDAPEPGATGTPGVTAPSDDDEAVDRMPVPPLPIAPTAYPTSPPLEAVIDTFWEVGSEADLKTQPLEPPQRPLELLEHLGPSPFERGGFPLIGFLATTYEKVSRYALDRSAE